MPKGYPGITCKVCKQTSSDFNNPQYQVCSACLQIMANCSICNSPMFKYAKGGKLRLTCSRSCSMEKNHPHINLICKTCNQPFTRPQYQVTAAKKRGVLHQYCSPQCRSNSPEFQNILSQKAKARYKNPIYKAKWKKGIDQRTKSEEWRASPQFRKGKNNKFYKGNATEREKSNRSPEYAAWRTAVFQRDDYTCQKCGERGGQLIAHHIKEWAIHPGLRYELSNGLTVCEPCHWKLHGLKKRKKTYHCIDCGARKKDPRGKRCSSCGTIHGYPDHKRVKDIICEHCKKTFHPDKKTRRFCSRQCHSNYCKSS